MCVAGAVAGFTLLISHWRVWVHLLAMCRVENYQHIVGVMAGKAFVSSLGLWQFFSNRAHLDRFIFSKARHVSRQPRDDAQKINGP
jgi:hypothetical protein